MSHKRHDIGVAKHIGQYSDAVEVVPGLRWLYTSGTPGVAADGSIPPGIEEQSRLAWENILKIVADASMHVAHIVKVTTSLIDERDMPAYIAVRNEFLGDHRPAFMLQIVSRLIKPEVRVEIEVIAARE
jgi:2-iminobutanoate/2-iminopropanoate deaminase